MARVLKPLDVVSLMVVPYSWDGRVCRQPKLFPQASGKISLLLNH
jgi:hypothetical protein